MSSIKTVVDWLTDGARSAPRPEGVLAELCQRMVRCGVPLWRVAVFVTTLHPDIAGRRFIWHSASGISTDEALFELFETEDFKSNPIAAVYAGRAPLRRRLFDPDCPDDFPFLRELRAEGVTDYVAFPLPFTDGTVHVATWTTRQPRGFTAGQFADIESIIPPLTRVAEIRALRRTATNLLDTYVGRHAGERILAGKIRRGYVEEIRAAIWLSDMRGFTALSERLPPHDLVDLLNRYFDCQVPAIIEQGGEVLKFIGDGLLAIFPLSAHGDDASAVCERALTSARKARTFVDALDAPLCVANKDAVRFGLALHIGQVKYGNIGGGNRLDFTCIGPAVNLAARLEKVASQLGRTVVASEEFVSHCPDEFVPLGEFSVAGFSNAQPVFGLK